MKKGLINEAFRLQQIAGIAPINETGLQNEENGGYDFQPDADKIAYKLAKEYMKEEGIEDEDEALNYAAQEIIEYLENMYTQYMEGAKPGLRNEQVGNTKTYYVYNAYGDTEIKPYEAFGFDGTEEWEELKFEFPSSVIKKYYEFDGVGKVVADANASKEEVLADLEQIDDELF